MRQYLGPTLGIVCAAALMLGAGASAGEDTALTPQITWGLSDGRLVRTTKVRFRFGASTQAAFECSLDHGAYRGCGSPFRATVRSGRHLFAVRPSGHSNVTSRSWTVSPRYNPSPGHQCTTWAYAKRPEIFDFTQSVAFTPDWRAAHWAENAKRVGFPVNHRPANRDIAVWPSGYAGAGAPGHVAYVTRVHKDGAITVTEMNSTRGRRISKWVDIATVPARVASHLQYIHRLR
jgi:surface antigen